MQRLRRTTSESQEPVRQNSERRKLERARSSNLNSNASNKPCRRRLRRHWKGVVFSCACACVVLLSIPRGSETHQQANQGASSIFRSNLRQQDTCPGDRQWLDLPPGVDIDLHVVARGNTNNLRATLTSLAQACYPEDAKLPLHVWALTAHAREVMPAQDGFLWTHGTYQFHTLTTEHGEVPPLEGWARMWTDPLDTEVRLVLPEGLEVSNLFYFWLSSMLDRYLGDKQATMEEREIFRENAFGISLSATGLTEVSGTPLSWEAYEAADGSRPVFHTLPGSRGTAFFGWQWRDFYAFMNARARVLESDSWEGESLLHTPGGGEVMHSWAGSLERFLAEFSHGRGLGILHPNLNGEVSFARQVPFSSADWQQDQEQQGQQQRLRGEGDGVGSQAVAAAQAGGAGARSTPMPTLRGSDDGGAGGSGQREPEGLIRTYKEASLLVRKFPSVSAVSAYDLTFRRHPDLTHLRLLAYRFFQRLGASASSRNEELEELWRRPGVPKPTYGDAKYLIYQPQFGMGNQLRALEAALAIARVLRRMLVVPDYMADNGEGKPVRYDAIWEFGFLEELVGRTNVILQGDFDALLEDEEVIEPPKTVYLADMPIKQLAGNNQYFDRMGWGELPQVPLPLANATEAGWTELQSIEDQVLAVSALFGMFQGWNEGSPVGDKHWHAMVKLHVSEEASWVHDFVDDSLLRFRRKAMEAAAAARTPALPEGVGDDGDGGRGGVGGGWGRELASTQFMCAHVRRQDFKASCSCYEEEYRSGNARDWVKEALGSGGVCWVDEGNFRDTVAVMLRQAPDQLGVVPQFVFATSDDERFLENIKHGNAVPVFTLDDVSLPREVSGRGPRGNGAGAGVGGLAETSASAAGQAITPDEINAALPAIDVAVCSRGALLTLNHFSTYSALIKAKAKAQPDFVRGLYWEDPPAMSNWWTTFFDWFQRQWRRVYH